MHCGCKRIYGLHMMKHNRLFAECEVLDNFRGLCGPGTRTVICKLVLEDRRGQQHWIRFIVWLSLTCWCAQHYLLTYLLT